MGILTLGTRRFIGTDPRIAERSPDCIKKIPSFLNTKQLYMELLKKQGNKIRNLNRNRHFKTRRMRSCKKCLIFLNNCSIIEKVKNSIKKDNIKNVL